jgi:hypothetical protein
MMGIQHNTVGVGAHSFDDCMVLIFSGFFDRNELSSIGITTNLTLKMET